MTDQPLEPEEPAPEDVVDDAEPTRIVTPQPEPDTTGEAGEAPPEADAEAVAEAAAEPAAPAEPRRLLRSRDDRVIAGVCGGLGKYLGVDPVLVRIAALVLVFAGGAGILLYVIGWIAMPEEAPGEGAAATTQQTSGAVILGFVFVVLGAFFLLDELWPDFLSWQYVWPIVLIGVGAAILLRARA